MTIGARASPRALQKNFALPYLQKRVENTPPMVLQIRFAIWLTLQIEVETLHICKPSTTLHLQFRPSTSDSVPPPPHPPPRAISLRPSALPATRARPPYLTRPPSSFLAKDPSAAKVSRASSSKVPPWISISLSSIPVAWRPLFVGFWDGRVW